ncbi:hypothetical protein OOZ19_18225 [Saccharopolyspora sp. NFXS83]|uniref:hypothetical protein n=1 Tax=Saccharopolyspora sp. NFXS83 TaxID=2993560 RepID=UPI00224B8372|nr:hypothetical protein [Saccharopolyspora sp. NFXS83]MCX2732178.1 hypothetical protein [Saccharopolyspora sp. NFXS83]
MPPSAPPRTVRIAAALTIAEAVAGLAFAVALLVRTTASDLGAVNTLDRTDTFAEAGYFAIISLAVLAAGIGMWQGRHWARTPALLLQLILIGIAWYAIGPSKQPLIGFAIAVPPVAVLWLMFNRQGRTWSLYGRPGLGGDGSGKD